MSSKYEKVARTAAATLSAGSLAVLASRAEAQPDALGRSSAPSFIENDYKQAAETARQAEQNPQSFINSFDKKLVKEIQLMHSSPYFSSKKNEPLSKALHAVLTVDFVSAPSRQYPGRYDELAMAKIKGEDVPLSVDITLGSDAKSYESVRHYESHSIFVQADNSGKFSRKTASIQASNPLGQSSDTYYLVSSEGYPSPKVAEDTVKYSDDSAKVSAAYSASLKQIHSIATRK